MYMKKKLVIIISVIFYFSFIVLSVCFLNATPHFSLSNLDNINNGYVFLAVVIEICIILSPLVIIFSKVIFDENPGQMNE
ncbi:hypothetical protein D7D82_22600 [Escherichia coli]|nr:hypothetical protein [Escherichia coli]ELC96046.1 hypothetical protein A13W_01723 [Escherichia coli KTE193]ELI35174.1 hypothetical protein WIC_00004 [Escherichia coli KTE112]KTH46341.1 hypothetical protein ASV23_10750 [Enterobacter hormaechei subsp. steigerwaltii]CZW01078.1 Uncharacterised protein [Enterobacter hormaechei]